MRYYYLIWVFVTVLLPKVTFSQVSDDNVVTAEDTQVSYNITTNDIVPDINVASVDFDPGTGGYQNSLSLAEGNLSVDNSGIITFTPTANYFGSFSVPYEVSDNLFVVAGSAVINITVTSVNDPPVADDDSGSGDEGEVVVVAVQSNDVDIDGTLDAATLDLDVSTAGFQTSIFTANGTWSVVGGSIQFAPAANFFGNVSRTYAISDNNGAVSNAANISITINSVNPAPVANNDTGSANENVTLNISILANDTDDGSLVPTSVDLDPSTGGQQTILNLGSGTATVDASGVLQFVPTTNYNGPVSIQYTVQDNEGATSNIATISITINSVNPAPVANNDIGSANENVTVNISILANDTDDGSLVPTSVDIDPSTGGQQTILNLGSGTATVNASGVLQFVPALDYNGPVSIQYTVQDNEGATSNIATVSITINSVNPAPVANNDTGSANENVTLNISILANDTDDGSLDPTSVDLDPSTGGQQTTLNLGSGTATVNASGVLQFVPTLDYNGPVSIQYTVEDTEGATSNIATVSITINSVNPAPVANNDSGSANENVTLNISILANDTDDGSLDPTSVDLDPATGGQQTTRNLGSGTATVNASGVLQFVPAFNYNGPVSIQYTVEDNEGATSNMATISITINSVNPAPVANNDTGSANENVTLNISILANDTDDGSLVPTSVDLDPATGGQQNTLNLGSGTATVNASGVLQFVPALNYNGPVSIQYTVADNEGATSNIATVSITINSVNPAPVANNDTGNANENVTLNISILANDTDDGSLNSATVDLDPATAGQQTTRTLASGVATVNASGVLQFVPTLNFNGPVSIQYTVQDNEGATSNVATVSITINSVNPAPVANNDAASTNENVAVNVNVISNDTDDTGIDASTVDLDPVTAGQQTSRTVTGGVATVNPTGVLHFVPTTNFNGSVVISYTVRDTEGAVSNTAQVTITVISVNAAPVANNDAGGANENTTVTISILANDTDDTGLNAGSVDLNPAAAGQQTSLSLASGTASANASGVLQFVPNANFNGVVNIQYTVNDVEGATSNTAQITITINSVNTPPVANADAGSANENVTVTISILANDTDDTGLDATSVDLNPSTAGQQTSLNLASGVASVNASGVLQFVPVLNFNGIVNLQYTVRDVEGATSNSAQVVITISSVNTPPVAVDDVGGGNENTTVNVSILANDTDVEGLDPTSVDLDPGTAGQQTTLALSSGTASVNASGVLQFVPTANFNGVVTISYTVEDTDGAVSNTANVVITINSVNTAPVAVADAASTNEDNAVSLNVVANDLDDGTVVASSVDLDVSTAGVQKTLATSNGNYSVDNNGVVTYTPVTNFYGIATIQYVVSDNDGVSSNAANITITVISVNDNPVAVNDAASTNQNQAGTVNVVANDTDDSGIDPSTVDLDPLTGGRQNSFSVAEGNFTVNSSGQVTFSPVATFSGVVAINYTVADLQGAASNQATITFTVIRVNTKPVANADGATTDEDTPVTFNILTNDTDDISINKASVDLDITTNGIQNSRTVTGGSFVVNANGDVTFTPSANFSGSITIRYTVADNEGLTSDAANINVTINAVNDVPVAVDDSRTVNEDNNAVINLLANDVDVDGTLAAGSVDLDPVTAGRQTSVAVTGGTFSVDASGVMTFTPNANYNGSATASYTVEDNQGGRSNVAAINITITSVNDAPVAVNDIASTPQNVPVAFNILTNDSDSDGSINAATIDLNPSVNGVQKSINVGGGTYTVDNSGLVNFNPTNNFNGTSSITYTVQDNNSATSNAATITVLVSFVNQKPVANHDAGVTNEDVAVNVNVVSNDTDEGSINVTSVDLDPATNGIQNTITNTFGKFTANASGVVNFVPALNFNGAATCTYTVNDNLGETSNTATITITVNSVNDAPVANEDNATGTENQALVINVLSNDSDVDNALDPATVDLVPGTAGIDLSLTTAQGTFAVNTTTGAVTFTPVASFFGPVTVSYRVKDIGGAQSNIASIKINISNVNDPPAFDAIADQRVFRNSNTKTITITGITPGPGETESLLISASSGNTPLIPTPVITYNGTGATATLSFKPQPNQFGTAQITVKAVDEGLKEFTRTFTVTVVNVEITSVPVTVAIVGETYKYDITTTEISETVTIAGTQIPSWTTITSTGKNTATLSGTPPANASSSTVILQLKDGTTVLNEQTFTLLVKRNPTASSFELQTNEDVEIVLAASNFTAGFTDPDNDPFSQVKITALPRHGDVLLGTTPVVVNQVISANSLTNLVYRPGLNYTGQDTLYFKSGDDYSFTANPNFIAFVIVPFNDPPEITVIETEPLVVDIGTETAQVITTTFDAEDADSELLTGAIIGFRAANYDPDHDLLIFEDTPKIKGDFDEKTGILTLTGAATVEEYVNAIRTVQYEFDKLYEIITTPRVVYFSLNDGVASSLEKERTLNLIYNFVDLKIPNVFTPDGNGSHEVWPFEDEGELEQYPDAIIRVFDERGGLVHETFGFATPWDGKRKGVDVPAGTYFYTIDLKYGRIRYNGSVTILRAGE